jgi:hypothetical protein
MIFQILRINLSIHLTIALDPEAATGSRRASQNSLKLKPAMKYTEPY